MTHRRSSVLNAELPLGGRERDVHDRRVEDEHQLRDGDDEQDELTPPLRLLGYVGRGRHLTTDH